MCEKIKAIVVMTFSVVFGWKIEFLSSGRDIGVEAMHYNEENCVPFEKYDVSCISWTSWTISNIYRTESKILT